MRKHFVRSIPLILLFGVLSFTPVYAQNTATACINTDIGNPKVSPNIPPECGNSYVGVEGLLTPPNLGPENATHKGYYQLPKSTDGSYMSYSCPAQSWGSKELISVLYTVSQRWKKENPKGIIMIGDLNASGHKSHKWGRGVDIQGKTNAGKWIMKFDAGNYDREATIKFGKMLVDTNHVLNIWYNDQAVNSAVLAYAKSSGKSIVMQPIPGHNNHFHLDVVQPAKLGVWEPGC